MSTIYLTVATMLTLFDISKAIDENGRVVELEATFQSDNILKWVAIIPLGAEMALMVVVAVVQSCSSAASNSGPRLMRN